VCQVGKSEMGQSRHFNRAALTSGLPRSADILRIHQHVSNVPQGDITSLFNQLVRAGEDARRQLEAERFGGL
jgi:hypothetical protein